MSVWGGPMAKTAILSARPTLTETSGKHHNPYPHDHSR